MGWAWSLDGNEAREGKALEEAEVTRLLEPQRLLKRRVENLVKGQAVGAWCELPGGRVVVATADGTVTVFSVKSGQRLRETRLEGQGCKQTPCELCALPGDVVIVKCASERIEEGHSYAAWDLRKDRPDGLQRLSGAGHMFGMRRRQRASSSRGPSPSSRPSRSSPSTRRPTVRKQGRE